MKSNRRTWCDQQVQQVQRPASTASSETETARRRDARRTQDGRRPYADVAQDGRTRDARRTQIRCDFR